MVKIFVLNKDRQEMSSLGYQECNSKYYGKTFIYGFLIPKADLSIIGDFVTVIEKE